jgi:hypothetical protein
MMGLQLKRIHTIPVYEGDSPMESYFQIVEADLLEEDEGINREVAAWANIGVFENTQGDVVTAPLVFDEPFEGIDDTGIRPEVDFDNEPVYKEEE